MEFAKICRGRALYTEENRIWVAKGMKFFAVDKVGKRVTREYSVGGLLQKLLSSVRLSRQLLREGLHHLVPLKNGNIFVVAKKKAYTIGENGEIKYVFEGFRGNKPAHQGVCQTPDGTIFFGEYTINVSHENDTELYRSTDGGKTFRSVLKFTGEQIRHIHFIKYDPYEKCIWLGTGDEDKENLLMRSVDNGDTWETVGGGSQDWRAVGVCFNEKSLVWGTDAGSVPDTNHIIEMDRATHALKIISDAEGPCHGCGSLSDGRVFISTGVEGGENEKDRFARLKEIKNGVISDIMKEKKDIFPFILQYGVMRFPAGTENIDRAVFTMFGLRGNGEEVYVEKRD